jgi:hypothetical protein
MLSININKLRGEVELREQRKTKIYEKILDLCYQRILNSNKKNDDYACSYIVPNVVFGLPLYDVNECITFIINKLVEKEFNIVYAFPTTIHISWKPVEKIGKIDNNKNKQASQKYIGDTKNHYKLKDKDIYNTQDQNNENNENNQNSQYNKSKNYKPIDDYTQSKSIIYDADDINLFQSKLDNLFN